ncbi:MAG: hypothetical protein RJA76_162 [Bacteroidota bacterium]|jgi:hypothetical protein
MDYFSNRTFTVATKHQKGKVLGPILAQEFDLHYVALEALDTDQLGTFSGEIKRQESAIETAQKKCQLAFEQTGIDLVLASEGSFGSHPHYFFLPGNEEILLLCDFKYNYQISVHSLSTNTNFASAAFPGQTDLSEFLNMVSFPSHKLMIKSSENNVLDIRKGIGSMKELQEAIDYYMSSYGSYFLETDMRAMHNPTRMLHIKSLGQQLIKKMKKACPNCGIPGFSVNQLIRGKLCGQCFQPTKGILMEQFCCHSCNYTCTVDVPTENEFEDPMYCDFCNP